MRATSYAVRCANQISNRGVERNKPTGLRARRRGLINVGLKQLRVLLLVLLPNAVEPHAAPRLVDDFVPGSTFGPAVAVLNPLLLDQQQVSRQARASVL